MDVLLESPLAVAGLGLVLVTLAAIWFVQSRSRTGMAVLTLAVALTASGIALERAVLTPRERVLATIDKLFDAIDADDLSRVLRAIDPAAIQVQTDAEVLMPMFDVERAGTGGEVRVEIVGSQATATFKPVIRVRHLKTGATGAYFDDLEMTFVQRGDDWLLSGYTPAQDWRREAAKLR